MSLNYDLTAIPLETRTIIADHDKRNPFYIEGKSKPENEFDYREGDRLMSPVTNALIWGTMFVDMGEITTENAEEFYARTRITEQLSGAYLTQTNDTGNHTDRMITLQDVLGHVGLKTNVSTLKRPQWAKRLLDNRMRAVIESAKMQAQREKA